MKIHTPLFPNAVLIPPDPPALEADAVWAADETAADLVPAAGASLAQRARLFGAAPPLLSPVSPRPPPVLIVNGRTIRRDHPGILETAFSAGPGRTITLREMLGYYQNLPDGLLLSCFNVQSLGKDAFRIDIALRDGAGVQKGHHSYKIGPAPGDPGLVHDLYSDMRLHEPGNGLGAVLAAQWLLLLRHLGFERLQTNAGRMGIYYWPSRGFDFGDEDIRRAVLDDFRMYATIRAADNGLELTPRQREAIAEIKHAWELVHFELAWGDIVIPAGKRYLQSPTCNQPFMVCFDLRDDYEGWRYLRRGLAKNGMDHLLPDFLSQSPASTEK